MNQHRLVVNEDVIRDDDATVQGYPPDKMTSYRLFHQMTRITKEKGSLGHDDRLDAVAGAVAYWVEAMAQDADKAAEKLKDELMEKELKSFFANQLNEADRGGRPRRRSRRDGFSMSLQ
jgi:Autographiviridae terminase large subunit